MTFNGVHCNVGSGLDPDSGIFTVPVGGQYFFMFHIATHDNKKALLSIRRNGEEIASVFDQNHKDNHKNSMAGQNLLLDCQRGDEVGEVSFDILLQVAVYVYNGTWLTFFFVPLIFPSRWLSTRTMTRS